MSCSKLTREGRWKRRDTIFIVVVRQSFITTITFLYTMTVTVPLSKSWSMIGAELDDGNLASPPASTPRWLTRIWEWTTPAGFHSCRTSNKHWTVSLVFIDSSCWWVSFFYRRFSTVSRPLTDILNSPCDWLISGWVQFQLMFILALNFLFETRTDTNHKQFSLMNILNHNPNPFPCFLM